MNKNKTKIGYLVVWVTVNNINKVAKQYDWY